MKYTKHLLLGKDFQKPKRSKKNVNLIKIFIIFILKPNKLMMTVRNFEFE